MRFDMSDINTARRDTLWAIFSTDEEDSCVREKRIKKLDIIDIPSGAFETERYFGDNRSQSRCEQISAEK